MSEVISRHGMPAAKGPGAVGYVSFHSLPGSLRGKISDPMEG